MKNMQPLLLLTLLSTALANACPPPTTTIDTNSLSHIFNTTISLVNYKPELLSLISAPSLDTIKTYLTTKAAFVIPLFCIAGVSFLLLVGCCIQICCYNCCGQKKCGTPISVKSFKPCILSCCVYSFMMLSGLLMAAGIASFVVSSDLLKQTNYSICNFNSTLTDLFQGTTPGTTPSWSGADNFNSFAQQIAINFPNTIPTINSIFNSSSFTAATSDAPNSPFTLATAQYACPSNLNSATVSCPFSNTNNCLNGSNNQIPLFSSQFCNSSSNNSAAQLVSQEQEENSTLWQQSLVNLSELVKSLNANPIDFSQLVSGTAQLQSSITNYQLQMYSGLQVAQDNIYSGSVGLYAVIGFFVLMGLISFLSICCVYCTRNYKCRYLLYVLWVFFAFMAIIFFIISGTMLLGTLVAYDSCAAYNQLTTNQTSLQSLSYYNSSQALKLLDTCFYASPNSTNSIFDSISQKSNFMLVSSLQSLYLNSLPSTTFTQVSTTITNKLINYAGNPNQVSLKDATAAQNPQQALTDANSYASNGGSANCNAVHDTLAYNPTNCYPSLIVQNNTKPQCILIEDSSITVVDGRQGSFTSNNCSANFATYKNNFVALNTFGSQIKTLANSYLQDSGLNSYSANYFNYYNLVRGFMNSYLQSLFGSFLKPYQSLVGGSSCTYLSTSLNNLINNTCNNNFPYIYALTVLVIIMSCFFFLMMIFTYFLTVRMEFYEYLSGDLNNYEDAGDDKRAEIQMADMSSTNRQKLIPAPNFHNEGYSPERYPQRNFYSPHSSPYSQYPPPTLSNQPNKYSYGKNK